MSLIDVAVILAAVLWLLFHLVGAAFGWKIVIDPPKKHWLFYPQSFMRLFMTPPVLRIFTLASSATLLCAMAIGIMSWEN